MQVNTLDRKKEEYSHLHLDWDNLDWERLHRPFLDYRSEDEYTKILRAMRDVKNLYFTCKYILNIDPVLFQLACLEVMFKYPFPMLIASRGLSKSFMLAMYAILRSLILQGSKTIIVGAAFRQSKVVFEYMETIWNNAPVLQDICGDSSGPRRQTDAWVFKLGDSSVTAIPLGDGCVHGNTMVTYDNHFGYIDEECGTNQISLIKSYVWGNGQFKLTDEAYNNGIQKTKKIITKKGYIFEGTFNHGMKIIRDGITDFVRADEMKIGDDILIDRSNRWHNGQLNYITIDDAYTLGAMIGDGSYCNKYHLQFTTKDKEMIDIVKNTTQYNWKNIDDVHYKCYGKKIVSEWLNKWGLELTYTINKSLPLKIMSAQKELMTACLQGIFDSDGTLQVSTKKGGFGVTVSLTNTSEKLVRQIQFILLHYGIISSLRTRKRNDKWNTSYELLITGNNCRLFTKLIGFRLSRKRDKLLNGIASQQRTNTYENKICTKDIFYDTISTIEDSEAETFDIHVPDGNEYCANGFFSHNSKIRGQRASCIIADEFQSLPELIYEVVVAGFASVSASPAENVKKMAKIKYLKDQGLLTKEPEECRGGIYRGNQAILSGTGDWGFKHFAKYWKRYKDIINSRGDVNKLREIFSGDVDPNFNYKDYAVIRIPIELAPPGFMEEKHVRRSQATVNSMVFMQEFGATFPEDSDKFYRRSLIESCVVKEPIILPSGPVYFNAIVKGQKSRKYIYGIDPASESDNFAIVVLELHEDHRRIVHCWTTTRQKHMAKVKRQVVDDNAFYAYCARKIRNLMQEFPCEYIAMDSQGGGIAVMEALHDIKSLQSGELPIWSIMKKEGKDDNPLLWENSKDYGHDDNAGLHILEMVSMSKADYVADANHGMRKDFESRILLFPFFDPISIAEAFVEDNKEGRVDDTLETCVMDIEELKTELTTIDHTTTLAGRDRWMTPELVGEGGKKGFMRKDRYSALVIANSLARRYMLRDRSPNTYHSVGGYVRDTGEDRSSKGAMYVGPEYFTSQVGQMWGTVINRN